MHIILNLTTYIFLTLFTLIFPIILKSIETKYCLFYEYRGLYRDCKFNELDKETLTISIYEIMSLNRNVNYSNF